MFEFINIMYHFLSLPPAATIPKLAAFEAMDDSSKALHQNGGHVYENYHSPTGSTVTSLSSSGHSTGDESNCEGRQQSYIGLATI